VLKYPSNISGTDANNKVLILAFIFFILIFICRWLQNFFAVLLELSGIKFFCVGATPVGQTQKNLIPLSYIKTSFVTIY